MNPQDIVNFISGKGSEPKESSVTKANDRQVAGDHYGATIQHWDLVVALRMGYFAGQVTKYVTRWRKKNGIQDLEKAQHFAQKWVEVMYEVGAKDNPYYTQELLAKRFVGEYISANGLTGLEADIIHECCANEAVVVNGLLATLIKREKATLEPHGAE